MEKLPVLAINDPVLEPWKLRGKTIQSRLFAAPTSLGRSFDTPVVQNFFDQVGSNPLGIVGIGGVLFEPEESRRFTKYVGLHNPEDQATLRETIARLKRQGVVVIVQIVCFASVRDGEGNYIPGVVAYSESRFNEVVQSAIDGASICFDCGADGVEFHATHGSFLNQYVSPHFNQRTDQFGLGNRQFSAMRTLALETRRRHPEVLIGTRINAMESVSPGTQDVHPELITALEEADYDYVHISGGLSALCENGKFVFASSARKTNLDVFPRTLNRDSRRLDASRSILDQTSLPVLYTGGIETVAQARQVLGTHRFAAIGYSRQFVSDPRFVAKELEGRGSEVRSCIYCNFCAHFPTTCVLWTEAEGGFPEEERKQKIQELARGSNVEMAEGLICD